MILPSSFGGGGGLFVWMRFFTVGNSILYHFTGLWWSVGRQMVNFFGFGSPFWGLFGLLVEGLACSFLSSYCLSFRFHFDCWMGADNVSIDDALFVIPSLSFIGLWCHFFGNCSRRDFRFSGFGHTIVFAEMTRHRISLGMLLVLFCFIIFPVEVICFSFVLLWFDGFY